MIVHLHVVAQLTDDSQYWSNLHMHRPNVPHTHQYITRLSQGSPKRFDNAQIIPAQSIPDFVFVLQRLMLTPQPIV